MDLLLEELSDLISTFCMCSNGFWEVKLPGFWKKKKKTKFLVALINCLLVTQKISSKVEGGDLDPRNTQRKPSVILKKTFSAGIFRQSIRTRNPVEIGLSYRPDRARIFKLLRSPRIDSKESTVLAYVAWWAGTITLFQLGFWNRFLVVNFWPV